MVPCILQYASPARFQFPLPHPSVLSNHNPETLAETLALQLQHYSNETLAAWLQSVSRVQWGS